MGRTPPAWPCAALLLFAVAFGAAEARAQIAIKDVRDGAESRAAKPPGPLTRDELRGCMRTEMELAQREQALERDRVDHKKMLAAYEQARAAGGEAIPDGGAAGGPPQKITVDTINESADRLNARTEKMHADNAAYQEQCASRRYLLKDKTALMKEQKAAQRGAATPSAPASAAASRP